MKISKEWSERFLKVAHLVSTWSKDPRTQVGAILVDPKTKHIVSTGYNGFPSGIKDLEKRLYLRKVKYQYVIHAEANAILQARGRTDGMVMYCTMHPCNECAKLIIQSGIKNVVAPQPTRDSQEVAMNMLAEAGVFVWYTEDMELNDE